MKTWMRFIPMSFAIIFAVLASVSVYLFLNDKSEVTHAAVPTLSSVVVAKEAIAIGEKIEDHQLSVDQWSQGELPGASFHSTRSVVGRTARMNIEADEPIVESKLLATGENFASLIPEGMRAVTVSIKYSQGLAQILERGATVDVLALVTLKGTGAITAGVVVEKANVIAVHKQSTDKALKEALPSNMEVTLIVTPDEAKRIITAMNQGGIELIVRNDSNPARI